MTRMSGLHFEEEIVPIDDPTNRAELLLLSPSVRVPRLVHDGVAVWDTLAIGEYLHETRPGGGTSPPRSGRPRPLPLRLRGDARGVRESEVRPAHEPQGPASRLQGLGGGAGGHRAHHGHLARVPGPGAGPYLFGTLTMADAMYAPVVTRFLTYDVPLDPVCAAYGQRIMALPHMVEWVAAARAEPDALQELDVEF